MGQDWIVVCIDRKESIFQGKLGEFFNDRHTNAEIEALALPLYDLPQIPRIPYAADDAPDSQTTESGPIELPVEILYYILEDVAESIRDLINFASACHLFWDVSSPLIEQYFKARTWAGSRIICVGDYMDDLPPGVLSDEEQAAVEADHKLRDSTYQRTFYNYAEDALYTPDSGDSCLRRISRDINLPGAVREALACMLPVDYKYTCEPAVLRNLSQKLFVRSQAVEELNKRLTPNSKDGNNGFCLGDALMSRICWSSDPSASMRGPWDLTRGPWAGDRFDVMLEEEFEMEKGYEDWEDASEYVCDALGKCWEDYDA